MSAAEIVIEILDFAQRETLDARADRFHVEEIRSAGRAVPSFAPPASRALDLALAADLCPEEPVLFLSCCRVVFLAGRPLA